MSPKRKPPSGSEPKTMTLEEFNQPHQRHTGMAAWLRALPVNVPTALPDGLTTAKSAASSISGVAAYQGFRVRVRAIDGTIWVLRLPGGRS